MTTNLNDYRKLYIIVRTDKEYSIGKLLVHAGHICTEFTVKFRDDPLFKAWFENFEQTKIVLKGKDECHLDKLIHLAMANDLIWIAIEDVGFYQVSKGELIMVGVLATDEDAKKIGLKRLSLYK